MAIVSRGGRVINPQQQQADALQQGLAQAQQAMQFRQQQQLAQQELAQKNDQFMKELQLAEQEQQRIEAEQQLRFLWPIAQRRISQYGSVERAQNANDPIVQQMLQLINIRDNIPTNATDQLYQLREDSRREGIQEHSSIQSRQQPMQQGSPQDAQTRPWFGVGGGGDVPSKDNEKDNGGRSVHLTGGGGERLTEGETSQAIGSGGDVPSWGGGEAGVRVDAVGGQQTQSNRSGYDNTMQVPQENPSDGQTTERETGQEPDGKNVDIVSQNNADINWAFQYLLTNPTAQNADEIRSDMFRKMQENEEIGRERQQKQQLESLREQEELIRQQLKDDNLGSTERRALERRLQAIEQRRSQITMPETPEEAALRNSMEQGKSILEQTRSDFQQVLDRAGGENIVETGGEKLVEGEITSEQVQEATEELKTRIAESEPVSAADLTRMVRGGGPLVREGEEQDMTTYMKIMNDDDFMRQHFPEIYQQQLALKNNELTNRQMYESIRSLKAENAVLYEDIYGDPNKLNETMVEARREILSLQRDQAKEGLQYTNLQKQLLEQQLENLKAQVDGQGVTYEVLLEAFDALKKAQETGEEGLMEMGSFIWNLLLGSMQEADATGSVPGQVEVQSGTLLQRLNPFQSVQPSFQMRSNLPQGQFQPDIDFNQLGAVPEASTPTR